MSPALAGKFFISEPPGKPRPHHTLQCKTESISSKIRNKARMPTFTTFIQYSIGSPSWKESIGKKKKKGIQIERKDVKLSLFADDMMYQENLKDTTHTHTHTHKTTRNNTFSKVARHKVNTQKFVMFLYTSNELSEKFKRQSPL